MMMIVVVVRLVEILKKILTGSSSSLLLCFALLTGTILSIRLDISYALAQSGQYGCVYSPSDI